MSSDNNSIFNVRLGESNQDVPMAELKSMDVQASVLPYVELKSVYQIAPPCIITILPSPINISSTTSFYSMYIYIHQGTLVNIDIFKKKCCVRFAKFCGLVW